MEAAEGNVDWTDLSTYGFYCLEAAAMAAVNHLKLKVQRTHPGKVQAAKLLVSKYKLPDASTLLAFFTRTRRVRDPLAPGASVELATAQSGKFHC